MKIKKSRDDLNEYILFEIMQYTKQYIGSLALLFQ